MKPYNIQKEFLSTVLNNNKTIQNKDQEIYQELILYRFKEVLSSTYPIFTKYTNALELETLIKDFILSGCHTPYVWKIAEEFKEYLYSKRQLTLIQKEILEFELRQIKIYVKNDYIKSGNISYKKAYRLSKNASIMMLNYNIIDETFISDKGYILIYKNPYDFQVYHLSISKFLYYFFKYQRGNNTINKSIYLACKRVNIDYSDTKDIAKETIIGFVNDGILI